MEASGRGARHVAHDLAVTVPDGEDHGGGVLVGLRRERLPSGEGDVLIGGDARLFGFRACCLARLEFFSEVIGEHGTEGRVVRDVVGITLAVHAARASARERSARDVPVRAPDGEEGCLPRERRGIDLAQR